MPLPSIPQPVFAPITLFGGGFQDPSGKPLANGWLDWKLNHDSNISTLGGPTGTQVVAGITTRIYLDGNGNAISSPVWPNDQLTPSGSYYTVRAYDNTGIEVWAVPQQFVLQGYLPNQHVNIGTLQPTQP